jgi:hypothetical protein
LGPLVELASDLEAGLRLWGYFFLLILAVLYFQMKKVMRKRCHGEVENL